MNSLSGLAPQLAMLAPSNVLLAVVADLCPPPHPPSLLFMRTGDEIPDCGHWLPLEQPALVTAKVVSFFQTIEGR